MFANLIYVLSKSDLRFQNIKHALIIFGIKHKNFLTVTQPSSILPQARSTTEFWKVVYVQADLITTWKDLLKKKAACQSE